MTRPKKHPFAKTPAPQDGKYPARKALRLLWTARQRAGSRAAGWQFAVRLDELHRAGVTLTDLCRLIAERLVEYRVEVTTPGSRRRRFRPLRKLLIPEGSCFVLTKAGVAAARALLVGNTPADGAQRTADRPRWDGENGVFRYRGRVHRFQQEGENQTRVLATFEAQDWPEWIENSLPDDGLVPRRKRLSNVVKELNRTFKKWPIKFHGNTKRQHIGWERLA
jgi:hypothetical protein